MTSLLLIQQHQQLQNLRIIRMHAHQLLEALPGCFRLAIAALELRFEQDEFARGGTAREPGLQHHFSLLQSFHGNQAFQQEDPLCLAELVRGLKSLHQRCHLLIFSQATRPCTGFRGHGGSHDPTDQSSPNHGCQQQQNPTRALHPISNQPFQSEGIAVGWLQSSQGLLTPPGSASMRAHPIPPVTEPLQYRAIGLVRGTYAPTDPEQLTRGTLTDAQGVQLETVVLGRVLTLIRRHVPLDQPHLWVVYPRSRESDHLHLQIAGVWEPSTLAPDQEDASDTLPEGDDFFSVRGELIFTKPETGEMVVKVRQQARADGHRPLPFKLQIKGELPLEHLRHFVSLDLRRQGQELHLEQHEVIAPMPTRGGKSKGGRGRATSRARS